MVRQAHHDFRFPKIILLENNNIDLNSNLKQNNNQRTEHSELAELLLLPCF